MSDYFSRLADRALGRAEVLAPRVPYRFETVAPTVSAAPPDDSGEEPSSDFESSSPLEVLSPPPHVNQPSVPTLPRPQEPARNGLGRTSAAAPQAGSPQATHEPQRRQRPPTPVTMPQADNPSEPKTKAVLRPAPTQRNVRRTSQGPAPREKAQTSRREEVHPRIELHPTKIGKPLDAPISAAPEPRSEPTPARQPVPSAPKVRRAFHAETDRGIPVLHPRKKDEHAPGPSAKFSSPRRRAEPPEEPSIKVTIGRVEVRAVMEPPKPAARPRKPVRNAISLDDFLKRHEKRRR